MDPFVYKAALAVHIVGITIMAGATFIDFILFRQFRKTFAQDQPKALMMENLAYRLLLFTRIGLLVIVLSGVAMMAYMHQVWGAQVWFRVKIGVLLLIVANGLGIRRRMGMKLRKILQDGLPVETLSSKTSALQKNITTAQIFQMAFFLVIFVLSVFKFN